MKIFTYAIACIGFLFMHLIALNDCASCEYKQYRRSLRPERYTMDYKEYRTEWDEEGCLTDEETAQLNRQTLPKTDTIGMSMRGMTTP